MKRQIQRNWLSDWYAPTRPKKLSREEFVARYMPKYKEKYRSSSPGGRLTKNGRMTNPNSSHWQAQQTKRDNRINEAYEAYCSDYEAALEMGTWKE